MLVLIKINLDLMSQGVCQDLGLTSAASDEGTTK